MAQFTVLEEDDSPTYFRNGYTGLTWAKRIQIIKNMYKSAALFSTIFWLFILSACGTSGTPDEKDLPPLTTEVPQDTTTVTAIVLEKKSFEKEIISQGTIEAIAKSDVVFPIDKMIEKINVRTGHRVEKDDVLATLNNYDLKHECDLINQELKQTWLKINTKLVSLGYTMSDTSRLDAQLWDNIKIENGLHALHLRMKIAKYKLNQSIVTAPISGLVADVEAQEGNPSSNYMKLCTIISDYQMQVKFALLQAELGAVKRGRKAIVSPMHQPKQLFTATITAINPQVDEYGVIWAYAKISKSGGKLLEGMKARVIIKETVPGQLVVPKSAVVDRQNRFVTFVYKNRQAHWIYAQILFENTTQYAIDDSGPQVGDTVIVSNNFDLAHLEDVRLL